MKKSFYIVLILLFSCQGNIKEKKVDEFWDWFILNNKNFRTNNWDEINETLDSIHNRLIRIDTNARLVYYKTNDSVVHLNFTAGGHEDSFESIELIISKAPKISKFEFTGFVPRSTANEVSVDYFNKTISDKDIYFSYTEEPDTKRINVVLYTKNFENNVDFKHYVFVILTGIVGEQDAVRFLNKINYRSINDTTNNNVYKLKSITDIIDRKK